VAWFDCGVYLIRNTVNGKVYVGSAQSIKARWYRHLKMLREGTHDNQKLQRAWDKYGESAFEFEVIAYGLGLDLFWQEQLAINAFDAVRAGYNIAPVAGSSMAGRKHSQATKELMSSVRKGKKQSADWVSKRTSGFKNRPIPLKQRQQISETLSGRPATEGTARNLRKMAANRTPEYIAWLGRKGAASRWGFDFNEPKPHQCFYEETLLNSSIEAAHAVQEA